MAITYSGYGSDGTSTDELLRKWPVVSSSTSREPPTGTLPTSTKTAASRNYSNSRFYDGAIDEFAVYNTALDAATIANHASLVPEPGSLCCWVRACLASWPTPGGSGGSSLGRQLNCHRNINPPSPLLGER